MIDVCASEYDTYLLGTWLGIALEGLGEGGGLTPRAPVVSYARQFEFPLYFTYTHACMYMCVRVCANHFGFDLLPIC